MMTDDLWNEAYANGAPPPAVPSRAPVAKVQAAGASGALAVLVVFVAGALGLEVPAEVAAAVATLAAYAGGYLRRAGA